MTATWAAVARKDLADALRSKLVWGLIAVFVAFLAMALPTANQLFPQSTTVDAEKALSGVAMLGQLFVSGIALVVGYLAVVGERESGSLRVLLSYPFTRRDIVAGKLVGRVLVTQIALLASYLLAGGLVVVLYGVPNPTAIVGFVAGSALLGLAFTGFAVGGSAATSGRGKAMALTIGSFAGMVFFWKPVVAGLYAVIEGSLPGIQVTEWYLFLQRLNPLASFRVLMETSLGERVTAVPRLPVEDVPFNAHLEVFETSNRLAGSVPFYLEDWFAVVVLLAWAVIPAVLGYRRFRRADLG